MLLFVHLQVGKALARSFWNRSGCKKRILKQEWLQKSNAGTNWKMKSGFKLVK